MKLFIKKLPSFNNKLYANNANLTIVDSSTTRNYTSIDTPLLNIKPTIIGPIVIQLDITIVTINHKGILNLPT